MSEVQVEVNVPVYRDECLKYSLMDIFLCRLMCVRVKYDGNITVFNYVWLRYSVREILLCTVM